MYRGSLQKIWLRDKSVYPIIGILSTALSGALAFTFYKFCSCPDICSSKKKRQEIIR